MAGTRATKSNILDADCPHVSANGDATYDNIAKLDPGVYNATKSTKPTVPQVAIVNQAADLEGHALDSSTTVANGASNKANPGSVIEPVRGHAHAINRSYAAVTATHPFRLDFNKLNNGTSGNVTWASKLMEGRQLDGGLTLKKVDMDKNT
jgi:hypothetical protein